MNTAVKKILLTGTALMAVSMICAGTAQASELSNPTHPTITVSDATGLQETTGTTAVTIDAGAGALTFGTNGVHSVTMNAAGGTLTLNLTSTGGANGATFADDVVATAGNIIINNTNGTAYFNGNVSANVAVNAGSNSADPTANVTINTVNAENIVFAGTINAVDAGQPPFRSPGVECRFCC